MFCENCGTKIKGDADFCHNCGVQLNQADHAILIAETSSFIKDDISIVFYSRDWHQKKVFVVNSFPYVDILIDKNNLYLIKLPRYHGSIIGALIGFIVLSIIGALVGYSIGSDKDKDKREWFRSAWVDKNNKITSLEFRNNLYKQIPLNDLKNKLFFKERKLVFDFGHKNNKVSFGKSQVEVEQIKQLLKNYVL